jgi:hypothetical protein
MKKHIFFVSLATAGLAYAQPHYFFDASFIYWQAKEDGLDLAKSAVLSHLGKSFYEPNGIQVKQAFPYNPGFKIGTGFTGNDWGIIAEYTWLRSHSKTHKTAPDNTSIIEGEGAFSAYDWFLQLSSLNQSPVATSIHSDLHIDLNLLNLLGTHPFYSGKHVCISGAFGLLAATIHQKINIYMPDAITLITIPTGRLYIPPKDITSHNHSHAWGLGPKICLNTQYFLGKGIYLQGTWATSLLYMRYTSIKHSEDLIFEFSPANPLLDTAKQSSLNISRSAYGSLRPVLELNLGLGWKRNFFEEKYRIDLSATYDFSFFWEQNMIRQMLDEYYTGAGSTPGNLYYQGLTVTAGFGF